MFFLSTKKFTEDGIALDPIIAPENSYLFDTGSLF
jgi:hypothetical protein